MVAYLPTASRAQLDTCLPQAGSNWEREQSLMWKTYVLRSRKEYRFYIGMCKDLERRIKEHNAGKTKSTKGYRPWELLFYEEFESLQEARNRELYLKSGIGREYIKELWSRSSAG